MSTGTIALLIIFYKKSARQKQYLYADNAMLFATIREAISRGKLYDGNYDDDSNGVNQPPCPMVLVIG